MSRYIIKVDRKASIFVLEDSVERMKWFRERFPKLVHADSVEGAIPLLVEKKFDWVFLDHDLGILDYKGSSEKGSGKDVAKFLTGANWIGYNVVIHSWNPIGAAAMKDLLTGAVAIPFGQFDIEFIGG